jgi:hypothetical protein
MDGRIPINRGEKIMRAFMKGAAQGLCILACLAALPIDPSAAADDFYKG